MKRMIFEDNPKQALSMLLARAYYDDASTDKCINFTSGGKGIIKYLEEHNIKSDFIVYVDVVPDNFTTIENYIKCKNYIAKMNFVNAYVIPIPCIEFYVIKAFVEDSKYSDLVLHQIDYKKSEYDKNGKKLATGTFERFCKSVLRNYKSCMGENKRFYKVPCICAEKPYVEVCGELSMDYKAWKLVTSLPTFLKSERNVFENDADVCIETVIGNQINAYYELAQKYKELGYIPEVISLDIEKNKIILKDVNNAISVLDAML